MPWYPKDVDVTDGAVTKWWLWTCNLGEHTAHRIGHRTGVLDARKSGRVSLPLRSRQRLRGMRRPGPRGQGWEHSGLRPNALAACGAAEHAGLRSTGASAGAPNMWHFTSRPQLREAVLNEPGARLEVWPAHAGRRGSGELASRGERLAGFEMLVLSFWRPRWRGARNFAPPIIKRCGYPRRF